MSFSDLFKKSVVEGFANADISLSKILVTLGITVVLALYIFAIYRLATKSVFYSKGFAISMAAISVITAAILIAMQSNLVISWAWWARCPLCVSVPPSRTPWICCSCSGPSVWASSAARACTAWPSSVPWW